MADFADRPPRGRTESRRRARPPQREHADRLDVLGIAEDLPHFGVHQPREDRRERISGDRVGLELPDRAQRMEHVEDAEFGHASYIPGMVTNSRTSIDDSPGEWKCGWSFSKVTASSTDSASRIE